MRHPAARRTGALLAALALLTAGCAQDARPGTAAYVGADTVSVADLQARVDAALVYRTEAGSPEVRDQVPAITQLVLAQEIRHGLLEQALTRTGFAVDTAAVDEQLQGADQTLLESEQLSFLTPDTLEPFLRDQLVTIQLGQDAWDGLAVTLDVVSATNRTDAVAKAQRMAAGEDEAAAVAEETLAAGGQASQGIELTPGTVDPVIFATPVFSAEQGSGLAFQLQDSWQAARVVLRATDAEPEAGADVVTGEQADAQSAYGLGRSLLPVLAQDPEVTLNPRYGQWDAGQGAVIADTDVPVSVVVAPRA